MTNQTKRTIEYLDEVVFTTRRRMFSTALRNVEEYPSIVGSLADKKGFCAGGVAAEVAWGHGCHIQKEFLKLPAGNGFADMSGYTYDCELHLIPVAVLKWYGYDQDNKFLGFREPFEHNGVRYSSLMSLNDNGADRHTLATCVEQNLIRGVEL